MELENRVFGYEFASDNNNSGSFDWISSLSAVA
jgi:hypothetical protein